MIAVLALGTSFNRRSPFWICRLAFSSTNLSCSMRFLSLWPPILEPLLLLNIIIKPSTSLVSDILPLIPAFIEVFLRFPHSGRHFWRLGSNLPLNLGFLHLLIFFKKIKKKLVGIKYWFYTAWNYCLNQSFLFLNINLKLYIFIKIITFTPISIF